MKKEAFLEHVAAQPDSELAVVTRAANTRLDLHSHPFAAMALVLRGELTIAVGGEARLYRTGDVFLLAAGCEHTEVYGEDGATYLVART